MAKIFVHPRIVPAWLAAARHLESHQDRCDLNLLLEITDPKTLTKEDLDLMSIIDTTLMERNERPLKTVAGTIFPIGFYKNYGWPDFSAHYLEMMRRGKEKGTWGTYALRMFEKQRMSNGKLLSPIEVVINKLSRGNSSGTSSSRAYKNAYEIGLADVEDDLYDDVVNGANLALYNFKKDGKKLMGSACLSHISLKRVKSGDHTKLNLTAMYRSHYYCARALGNLIGLVQLQSFLAKESNLEVGTLTCLSSSATLDVSTWGGAVTAKRILSTHLPE